MLVLSRRLNEKLLIPCIRSAIQVLSIQGGQVRLGIDAPPEIAVFREEIYKCDPQESSSDKGAAAPRDRIAALLRNRLARLALGLDRLQRQMEEKLGASASGPGPARRRVRRTGPHRERPAGRLLRDEALRRLRAVTPC